MNIQPALKSQYHAGLNTLRETIDHCPEAMWYDPAEGFAAFWRVAYHTLFFTHFYLSPNEHSFTPWERARPEAQYLGPLFWQNNRLPKLCDPYTRADIMEYWNCCDRMIDPAVDALDLESPESGFPWYKMPKVEHQILNIRHIQNHAAALATRLRRGAGVQTQWIAKG
jgi:hypothetical protein